MMLNINDQYVAQLEHFIASLPEGVAQIKHSLDDEILKRVGDYKSGEMQTTPLSTELSQLRASLKSKL